MPSTPSSQHPTRRLLLKGGAAAVAAAGAVLAAPAAVAAPRSLANHTEDMKGLGHGPVPFDETYQGRHIVGRHAAYGSHGTHHGSGFHVFIDGEELHVMQNADGTWISVVNHYQPFCDPRAVARAAVRKLRGARLVPMAMA